MEDRIDRGTIWIGALLVFFGFSVLWFGLLKDPRDSLAMSAWPGVSERLCTPEGAASLAFGGLAGLLGIFLLVVGSLIGRAVIRWMIPARWLEERTHQKTPESPAHPVIQSRARAGAIESRIAIPLVAGFVGLFFIPWSYWGNAWTSVRESISTHTLAPLGSHAWDVFVVLVFLGCVLAAIAWALSETWSWRRFGELGLRMDPFPGAIGGDVGGMIVLPIELDRQHAVSIRLYCERIDKSRPRRAARIQTVWSDQRHFLSEPAGVRRSQVLFRFSVPEHLPPTGGPHRWEIAIKCALSGLDLVRVFRVPVEVSVARMTAAVRVCEQGSG